MSKRRGYGRLTAMMAVVARDAKRGLLPLFACMWLTTSVFAESAAQETAPALPDVEIVTSCMQANVPERLRMRYFTLHSEDESGREVGRHSQGRMAIQREAGRSSVNLRLDGPGDASGTSYLWRELEDRDETFVFLPALNRVRRVVGSGADAGVLDSEFSMRDLQQVQGAFSTGDAEMLGEAEVADRRVWQLRFTPDDDEPTPYIHVDAAVDQEHCVTLAADFVDEKGVVKRYSADPTTLREIEGIAYAGSLRMHNLRRGRISIATMDEIELPEELPQRLFRPNGFYMGN